MAADGDPEQLSPRPTPGSKSYLTTIGRRKLVLPLYQALLATPDGRQRAEAIYAKARPSYHPITVDSIDRLLKEQK